MNPIPEMPTRRELMLIGLTPLHADASVEALQHALKLFAMYPSRVLAAGFIDGLHERFADNVELWEQSEVGILAIGLSNEVEADAPEGVDITQSTDYAIGQWVATGDKSDLQELIRIARHRDGSTSTIVNGSEAAAVLSSVLDVPEFVELFKGVGFDPSAYTMGNFPPGADIASAPVAVVGSVAPAVNATAEVAAQGAVSLPPGGAAPVDLGFGHSPVTPMERAPVDLTVRAEGDRDAGLVVMGAQKISISRAVELATQLGAAVRKLVIPAEGYAWVDSTHDPLEGSRLLALDSVLGEGLEYLAADGAWFQGEVVQTPQTGRYTLRMFNRQTGGYQVLSSNEIDDMNVAKARLAVSVREERAELERLKKA